jgi:glyoxylate reductase
MAGSKRKPRVIVTRELSDAVMDRMAQLFDTRLNRQDIAMTRDELVAAVQDADVLVPTVTDTIDADLIEAAGDKLKLIANFGNGVDHIDLRAARAANIIVTNTPGVLTEDTADMTMALILSVPRRLAEGEKLVRSGRWTGGRRSPRKSASPWTFTASGCPSSARSVSANCCARSN